VVNRGEFVNIGRLPLRKSGRGGCNFTSATFVAMASAGERREGAMTSASAEEVVAGVIVGAGRVGQALERMGRGRDVVVRRGEKVSEHSTGPIFVCTRNDVLGAIVDATPA
jgi:hypothetical protein